MNELETTAVVVRDNNTAVGQALSVNEIVAQVNLIQQVMAKVMKDGEHYGTIPGCGDKKTLLQPGAQKLTMTFRLAPEYTIQETDLGRGHKEYRVVAALKSIQTGNFVGEGVGVCSTMESKYRYRSGARKCPTCGKETIIKGKAEYGGGWLCFARKGGCGAKWPDGAQVIEAQNIERVEHDNPADHYNTVLKMAKKRSFVDATITATAASDIFTQDIGDEEDNGNGGEDKKPEPTQKHYAPIETPGNEWGSATPAPKTPPAASQPTGAVEAPAEKKNRFLAYFRPYGDAAREVFIQQAFILPTETIEDIDNIKLDKLSRAQVSALVEEIKQEQVRRKQHAPVLSEGDAQLPDDLHDPADYKLPHPDSEPWRQLIVPFGKNKGTKLGDLAKGSLKFYVCDWEPKPHEFKGKMYQPKESDVVFHKTLQRYAKEIIQRYGFDREGVTP